MALDVCNSLACGRDLVSKVPSLTPPDVKERPFSHFGLARKKERHKKKRGGGAHYAGVTNGCDACACDGASGGAITLLRP